MPFNRVNQLRPAYQHENFQISGRQPLSGLPASADRQTQQNKNRISPDNFIKKLTEYCEQNRSSSACGVIVEGLRALPDYIPVEPEELTASLHEIELLLHQTCSKLDYTSLSALSDIHEYLLEYSREILRHPTADMLAGLYTDPEVLKEYIEKDNRLLQSHSGINIYFNTASIADVFDQKHEFADYDFMTPILAFNSHEGTLQKSWGLLDCIILRWLHSHDKNRDIQSQNFVRHVLKTASQQLQDQAISTLLLLSRSSINQLAPNTSQIKQEAQHQISTSVYGWSIISPYTSIKDTGFWQRNEQNQHLFLSCHILSLLSTVHQQDITPVLKKNIINAFSKSNGSRQRFLFLSTMTEQMLLQHQQHQFIKFLQNILPQEKADSQDIQAILKYTAATHSIFPLIMYLISHRMESPAVHINALQKKLDYFAWQDLKTALKILDINISEINNPLSHQVELLLAKGYSIDLDMDESMRADFIHQITQNHLSLCIDNTESMNWLHQPEDAPAYVQTLLKKGGVIFIDESPFAQQILESLNELKEGNRLNGIQLLNKVLTISFIHQASERSPALSSRAIELNPANLPFNPENKLTQIKKTSLKKSIKINTADKEAIYQWINAPDTSKTVVLESSTLKQSLAEIHLQSIACKLKIPVTYAQPLEQKIIIPFNESRFKKTGFIVSEDSFAQNLQWSIQLKNGQLTKRAGPLQQNMINPVYVLDNLSSEQRALLAQTNIPVYSLSKRKVDAASLLKLPIQHQHTRTVSLEYIPHEIQPQDLKLLNINPAQVIWIHPDDTYENLTVKLFKTIQFNQETGALIKIMHAYSESYIIGLERNSSLQQQLLSLHMPEPFFNLFGEIQPLKLIAPNHKIRIIVSEPLEYLPLGCYHSQILPVRQSDDESWPGFSLLPEKKQKPWISTDPLWDKQFDILQNYQSRDMLLPEIAEAFIKKRAVLLLGSASAGKTTLLQQLAHRDQVFMTNAGLWHTPQFITTLTDWAQTKPEYQRRIVLILDEATLQKDWSLFNSVFTSKPYVRLDNKIYPLSNRHKILLAGNLPDMPGRFFIPLLAQHAACFQLPLLTSKEIQQGVINPILNTIGQITPQFKNQLRYFLRKTHHTAAHVLGPDIATPRQLKTIALYLASLLCRRQDEIVQGNIHSHLSRFICDIYHGLADTAKNEDFFTKMQYHLKNEIDIFLPEKTGSLAPVAMPEMAPTTAVATIQHYLTELMQLKQCMINNLPPGEKSPAPLGLIFQSEPGIGKDETIKNFFKNDPNFIQINANQNIEDIYNKFMHAAKYGYVICFAEANTLKSAILESILNDILTGQMPNGTKVHPGFFAIMTINNTALPGRENLADAFKSRFIIIKIKHQNLTDSIVLADFYTEKARLKEYPNTFNMMSTSPVFAGIQADGWLDTYATAPRTLNRRIKEHAQGLPAAIVNRWFKNTGHKKNEFPFSLTLPMDDFFAENPKPENYDIILVTAETIADIITHDPKSEQIKATENIPFLWNITLPQISTPQVLPNLTSKNASLVPAIKHDISLYDLGRIQHHHNNTDLMFKECYLVLSKYDASGLTLLTHADNLLNKTLLHEYTSTIELKTALQHAHETVHNNQNYLSWTIAVPHQFAPRKDMISLAFSGAHGRLTTTLQGKVIQDQENDCKAIFNHGDIAALQAQLKGMGFQAWDELTLSYSIALIADNITELPQFNRQNYNAFELQGLFDQLPDLIQGMLTDIKFAVALGSTEQIALEIRKAIAVFAQTHEYQYQADEYLDALYHTNSSDYKTMQEHVAQVLLREKKGRCSHAAHAWAWLINNFTQLQANYMHGIFAATTISSETHAWIEVNINNTLHTFDSTPHGQLNQNPTPMLTNTVDKIMTDAEAQNFNLNLSNEKSDDTDSEESNTSSNNRLAFSFASKADKQDINTKKRKKINIFETLRDSSRKITPSSAETNIILKNSWVTALERKQLGKGFTLSSEGHIIDVTRIGKNTDKIFKKPYLHTQDSYKKIIFTDFKPNSEFVFIEPLVIQTLIDNGIEIIANQNGKLAPVQSSKDLYTQPVYEHTDIPYSLQGSQSHITSSQSEDYRHFLNEIWQKYNSQHNLHERITYLISHHFRPWILEPFHEISTLFNARAYAAEKANAHNSNLLFEWLDEKITDHDIQNALEHD